MYIQIMFILYILYTYIIFKSKFNTVIGKHFIILEVKYSTISMMT